MSHVCIDTLWKSNLDVEKMHGVPKEMIYKWSEVLCHFDPSNSHPILMMPVTSLHEVNHWITIELPCNLWKTIGKWWFNGI